MGVFHFICFLRIISCKGLRCCRVIITMERGGYAWECAHTLYYLISAGYLSIKHAVGWGWAGGSCFSPLPGPALTNNNDNNKIMSGPMLGYYSAMRQQPPLLSLYLAFASSSLNKERLSDLNSSSQCAAPIAEEKHKVVSME